MVDLMMVGQRASIVDAHSDALSVEATVYIEDNEMLVLLSFKDRTGAVLSSTIMTYLQWAMFREDVEELVENGRKLL